MTAITLSIGQRILIAFALVMVLWYVVGTWYNRRQGIHTLNWLRKGLATLGGQSHASWIGSAASGARLAVVKADAPFRQLEVAFLLESRELMPVWLVNRLRGKRDELIVKAQLRSRRRGEIEVVPADGRLERSLRQESESPWEWREGPHHLRVAYRGMRGEALSTAATPFLQDYGLYLRRFSWRRDKPNLLLSIRLDGLTERTATHFFEQLSAVFSLPEE
jgi:hypothetical protein